MIYLVDPNGFGGGRMAEKKSCHKVLLAAPIFLGDNEDFVDELSLDLPKQVGSNVVTDFSPVGVSLSTVSEGRPN